MLGLNQTTIEHNRPAVMVEAKPQSNQGRNPVFSFVLAVLQAIPTLAILCGLAAIGWYGHHTGWKIPKFSEWNGHVEEKDDWCAEHNVPESICVECKSDLMPKLPAVGWCKIHGVHECTLCNPSLAQVTPTPEISAAMLDKAKRSLDFDTRQANNPICKTHQRRIQFAEESLVEKAGVAVERVWKGTAVEAVHATGELTYDQTKMAHMSSRVVGTVVKVFAHRGDALRRGDAVLLIDAADVGKAKSELLQTLATYKLRAEQFATKSAAKGSVAESELRIAEATFRESEIRLDTAMQSLVNLGLPVEGMDWKSTSVEQLKAKLQFLSIPPAVLKTIEPAKLTSNLFALSAAIDGIVISRDIVEGELVELTRILFEIVDNRSLWLTLDLKAEDLRHIRKGQSVRFKPDGNQDEVSGTLSWINAQVDPKTRTVKVRANLANTEGTLRSNTFGSGQIIYREEPDVVMVPNEAIQFEGCCQIVFVRDKDFLKEGSPKVFHVRKVRTGAKGDSKTEIIAGVLPGELIVTKGSGSLLTELLRGNLGDGCACHGPQKD